MTQTGTLKVPATRIVRAALSNTLASGIFMASVSLWRSGQRDRRPDKTGSSVPPLVTGQLTGKSLLRLWVRTRGQVKMILVDINNFHPLPFALEREWITGLHGLEVINRRLPVAMMQLGRPDQREETARINAVDQPLVDDLNVVAEFLVEIRH